MEDTTLFPADLGTEEEVISHAKGMMILKAVSVRPAEDTVGVRAFALTRFDDA